MTKERYPLRGYLCVIAATLFWGLSATIAKILFKQKIDTLILVQTRSTFSFVLLFVWLVLFKRDDLKISKRDLFRFAPLGIIGVAGSNFTYYFTINKINVATAIVIQYLAPVLVLLYGILSKTEAVTGFKILSAFFSLFGCSLVVRAYDIGAFNMNGWGLMSGIASAVCWAFFNIYGKKLGKTYSTWQSLTFMFMFAGIFWLCINPPWKISHANYSASAWWIFLLFALISILIPHSFYFSGLKLIPPSVAIITSALEPVVAILSAWLLLGEKLVFVQVVGAIVVVISVLLLQIKRETAVAA